MPRVGNIKWYRISHLMWYHIGPTWGFMIYGSFKRNPLFAIAGDSKEIRWNLRFPWR